MVDDVARPAVAHDELEVGQSLEYRPGQASPLLGDDDDLVVDELIGEALRRDRLAVDGDRRIAGQARSNRHIPGRPRCNHRGSRSASMRTTSPGWRDRSRVRRYRHGSGRGRTPLRAGPVSRRDELANCPHLGIGATRPTRQDEFMDTYSRRGSGLRRDGFRSGRCRDCCAVARVSAEPSRVGRRHAAPDCGPATAFLAPDQRGYSARARPAGAAKVRPIAAGGRCRRPGRGRGARSRFTSSGTDWGAFVAWAVTARHPERVHTLTAVSVPHPKAFRLGDAARSSSEVLVHGRVPTSGPAGTATANEPRAIPRCRQRFSARSS